MFRAKQGHVPGTIQNQELILKIVQNEQNFLGEIENCKGLIGYGKILEDGQQVWVYVWVQSQEIRNCGINKTPKIWNPYTGFNQPPNYYK